MFERTFKNIDDVLWKETNCTTGLVNGPSGMLRPNHVDDLGLRRAQGIMVGDS
jgi:hypothetical protein